MSADPGREPAGRTFWSCLVLGWAVIAYGVFGVLANASRTHPADFARWFAGSALAHDLLVAPLVFAVGLALSRWIPPRIRPPIQAGLIVAASVSVVALPFVLGLGGPPDNPSALPLNYPGGLATFLALIALVTGMAVAWRLRNRDRPGSSAG